jgi:hypothetical protein
MRTLDDALVVGNREGDRRVVEPARDAEAAGEQLGGWVLVLAIWRARWTIWRV